jgi:hypothetical protein
MKVFLVAVALGLTNSVMVSPVLAQDAEVFCFADLMDKNDAEEKYNNAVNAYNSWSDSYNYNVNVIMNAHYQLTRDSSTCNYLCQLEALEGRDAALEELDMQGFLLQDAMTLGERDLYRAQSYYDACVSDHNGPGGGNPG